MLDLSKIVTADLESLITKDGHNQVYMAAWYNGKDSRIFDISSYKYNSKVMLKEFWLDLINHNQGSILYFHNWAGYDAILSLIPLIGLHEHGFTFTPVMQNNQVISFTVLKEIKGHNRVILTIKDSLKMIPGALGKLTRDDYQTLLLGEVLNLTVTKWSRSLKEGTVRIVRGLPYHLKADLNKRVKVLDNGKWVDTMPITL